MKVILSAGLLSLVAAVSMTGSTSSFAVEAENPYVYEYSGCALYDRNGNLQYGQTWSYSTYNGTVSAQCKVKGAFGPGPSTKFANFPCDTDYGPATKTSEQIDSKGNATMTCQIKL